MNDWLGIFTSVATGILAIVQWQQKNARHEHEKEDKRRADREAAIVARIGDLERHARESSEGHIANRGEVVNLTARVGKVESQQEKLADKQHETDKQNAVFAEKLNTIETSTSEILRILTESRASVPAMKGLPHGLI